MFKVGIVGCGVIAPSHVSAIKELEELQLYAVCDIISEKADEFAKKHGAEKVYYDYSQMLNDPKIDIIAICTPSGIHGEMLIAAVNSGKHIICEKPLEITSEKLKEIVNCVKNSKVKVGCVFQRRFHPNAIRVKKALERGELGKILLADAYFKYYRSPEYYKSAGWRATWEFDGGGALMNQGVHGVDLISWLMGGVESVSAVVRTQTHSIEVEDAAVSAIKYKNGAIGVLVGTTCVQPAQSTRFEIHGENGSIIFGDKGILSWNINGEEKSTEDICALGDETASDPKKALTGLSHTPIYQDLIESIQQNRQTVVSVEEGKKAVELILAIYKSSKEKREIAL